MILEKRHRALAMGAMMVLLPAFAVAPAIAQEAAPAKQQSETAPDGKPNADMQAVLDALKGLGAKPLHTLSVPEARSQASAADAAMTVQRDKKISPLPEAKVKTKDFSIPTPAGSLLARAYVPEGQGPFPLVVYYHGGGWVIADINTYDATPRAIAEGAKAVVVSVEYRHAPEHKFPAAHEDAFAAYKWLVENGGELNADSKRVAVVGESAGGNLAANVALMAKEAKVTQPVHQVLVYPIAGKDMETASYKANENTLPLGAKDMMWFVKEALPSKDEAADPRIDLVNRKDLAGLPSATVITAEFDPLRSEGQLLAENLQKAGVKVDAKDYKGVTHEFFGMAKVVPQAKEAQEAAIADLKQAFEAAK
ncbi:alpha/beta hydrolase [Aureimonas psammosilenae]|uniref:alpha/beta hydrolase n=1 Tax=Aureimonas psammosilenae TaxID=2495496 RepID=UPI001AED96FD|nr:alpha/beta hydrolase [Aureimonas psammosilenae]